MSPFAIGVLGAAAFLVLLLINAIRILPEYERGVVFRLGRLRPSDYGPGLFLLIPVVDRMMRISLRTVVHDVPPQDVITRDNVSIKVNAVVYFRVMSPRKAVVEVENYHYATSQLSQTTLRSVLGQVELDELLSGREKINHELQSILDKQTDPWGIKVSAVEVKHVDLPEVMQRAMARQAEAEREKRAKVIHAEGESQAASTLAAAAAELGRDPNSMQLRYLQTLTEIATERNSTLISSSIPGPTRSSCRHCSASFATWSWPISSRHCSIAPCAGVAPRAAWVWEPWKSVAPSCRWPVPFPRRIRGSRHSSPPTRCA
jgi:regulator of protease activity HflC (stomatin/prohibitin superfamily)